MRNAVVFLMYSLLVACGSGDGDNTPLFNPPVIVSGPVKLQFFRDANLTRPFTDGVTVIVHGEDEQSILRVVEVGDTGEAELGEFEGDFSITLAYRLRVNFGFGQTPSEDQLKLRSFIRTPLTALSEQNGTYMLQLSPVWAPRYRETIASDLTVAVTTDSVPTLVSGSADRIVSRLQPADSFRSGNCGPSFRDGLAAHLDVDLFDIDVQSDGLVSFLSTLEPERGDDLLQYGFLLDQAPVDNSDITFAADSRPVAIGVAVAGFDSSLQDGSERDDNAVLVDISGVRKDVAYRLSQIKSFYFSPPDLSDFFVISICPFGLSTNILPGSVNVADQFPVDFVVTRYHTTSTIGLEEAAAEDTSAENRQYTTNLCSEITQTDGLPTEIVIQPVALSYSTLDYDADSKRASWQNNAPSLLERQRLTIRVLTQRSIVEHLWTVDLPADRTSITPPSLPDDLAAEIEALLADPQSLEITGYDYRPPLNAPFFREAATAIAAPEPRHECSRALNWFNR